MYPSICLVCDPDPDRARGAVSRMLAGMGVVEANGASAACGPGWAAAAVPPPGDEPTAGAGVSCDGRDLLMWTGEIILPDTVPAAGAPATISAALLAGLRRAGAGYLARCDGSFCGAWWDSSHGRWLVFNDRFGQIPVFWQAESGRLVVGPRARLVWEAAGAALRIDPLAVAGLLRTQNVIDDRTLIAGVHWLNRGHALAWSPESHGLTRYCDFADASVLIHDEREAGDAYVEALRSCVRRHARSGGPLLLGISGGLDSRLILAVCHELGRVPSCFSAGFAFGGDVRFGRRAARVAGADHEWVPLADGRLSEQLARAIVETDGLHNVGHLPPAAALYDYLPGRAGGVLLEGYFNGVAGGATIPSDPGDTRLPPHQRAWARAMLHSGGPIGLIDALLEPGLASESRSLWEATIDRSCREAATDDPLRQAEYTINGPRRCRMDTLGTALLRRDVLLRTPATDAVMVRWFESVPPAIRRARRPFLDVLRRHFPRFARVPRSETGGMPVLAGRWLREYHWHREKLYRWWAGRRYPHFRRWGPAGNAIRAWTYQTLLHSGSLNVLLADDARIRPWVRREALLDLWSAAAIDPLQGMPLLGLFTVEIMVRRLESHSPVGPARPPVRFRRLQIGYGNQSRPLELAEVR